MEPSTQPSNNYDDPIVAQQAKNLTKAIFQTESGGNFTASGGSGETGAGQWMPDTWKAHARDVLGNENAPMTPDNQSVVAQGTIRKLIKEGKNAAQIAAIWNSGSDQNWENKVGKNSHGVDYNVPKYVKSVTDAYQTIKSGGQVGADPNNPSSVSAGTRPGLPPMARAISPGQAVQEQVPGLPSMPQAVSADGATPVAEQPKQKDGFLKKVESVITTLFPGKRIGEAIGTAIAKAGTDEQGKQFIDTYEKGPTALQVAGDVAQAGLMVAAPFTGGATSAVGRIGTSAALGAGTGVAAGLAKGDTGVGKLATEGLVGGAVGAAAGGVGELIRKASEWLPYSVARKYLPGTNPETAKYAVDKGLGSAGTMYDESTKRLATIGNHIDDVLNDPALEGVTAHADDIFPSIAERYPDAGLAPEAVGEQLKKLVPLQKGLVEKLQTTGLTAPELNNLKTAIGQATYKTVFDEPAVKAGKAIGNSAYASISDWLTDTIPAIRSDAPSMAPVFTEYSKELQLNAALAKLLRNADKAKLVTLPEIIAGMEGLEQGGIKGGLIAALLSKTVRNPSVNLMAGGLLNRAAPALTGPGAQAAGRFGTVEATRGLVGLSP